MQQRIRTTPVSVIRQGDRKLLEFFEEGHQELYNTRHDYDEKTNLFDRHLEKTNVVLESIHQWQEKFRLQFQQNQSSESTGELI